MVIEIPASVIEGQRRGHTVSAVVDSSGRLVVPARFRAALGFRRRQEVLLTLERDALTLRTSEGAVDAAVARAQALARRHGGGKGGEVDAFIAARRSEAGRE